MDEVLWRYFKNVEDAGTLVHEIEQIVYEKFSQREDISP
jgi:hypothetical protein